jgi:hypothetical protein
VDVVVVDGSLFALVRAVAVVAAPPLVGRAASATEGRLKVTIAATTPTTRHLARDMYDTLSRLT